MICPMKPENFKEIVQADNICFNRGSQGRTLESLAFLLQNNPTGCFVYKNDRGDVVGYLFTKILGEVGYIGPLGLLPDERGNGWGKQLLAQGIAHLKNAGCKTIGLETRPEMVDNIGMYLGMGFHPAPVTLMFSRKSGMASCSPYKVFDINGLPKNELEMFFARLEAASGIDISPDFYLCKEKNTGDFCFVKHNEKPSGFLAYTPLLHPYVWGGFVKDQNQDFSSHAFMALYENLSQKNAGHDLALRVNSRYTEFYKLLGGHFKVEKCLVRLLLHRHEGVFNEDNAQSVILRSWIS